MRKCSCGVEIPIARQRALPGVTTCIDCSTEQPVKGITTWDGKHTPVLQVVPPEKFRKGRSRMNADIGVTSYENFYIQKAHTAAQEVRNLSLVLKEERIEAEPVNRAPARCHPERPRMNPAGDCLDCALRKQRQRLRR